MNILIIEDEYGIRTNLAEILTYEGFSTLEAENGRVGIEMARDNLPDLIICDVMMPELDGYGVLTELRSDPLTATIPFIFLTARAERPAMRRGMELGADDYLTKPVTPDELLDAVNSRLEKHAKAQKEYELRLEELRDNIVHTLPHELRTPLTGIMGYAEFLATEADQLETHQISEMAGNIYNSARRLSHMIENYLFYAQIEMVRSDPERRRALRNQVTDNPHEIIVEIAAHYAERGNRSGDLTCKVSPVLLQIDHSNFEMMVKELADNAFKFSQSGDPVHIEGEDDGAMFRLRVSNQGRGMTADQIKRIGVYMQFERKMYEQQGSGLGLMIVKRLTELYGGDVSIESQPGATTTIEVTIPLAG